MGIMAIFMRETRTNYSNDLTRKSTKKLLSLTNFSYAFDGILFLIKTEHNPIIYLIVTLVVVLLGLVFHISKTEWSLLILAMSAVWMAEALNTAIELLADEMSEEMRERLGRAKDVAAGGVLIVAIGGAVIGTMVFLPYVTSLVK